MGRLSVYESKALRKAIFDEVVRGVFKTDDIATNLNCNYAAVRWHLEKLCDDKKLIKHNDDSDEFWIKCYLAPSKETKTAIICRYMISGGPRSYYTKRGWVKLRKEARLMLDVKAERVMMREKKIYRMYTYRVIRL